MSKAKAKGTRIETEIVKRHLALGVPAERVPMSGMLGGKYVGDVWIGRNNALTAEVKARKDGAGFATLEKWMGANHLMFLRRDRAEPMVVLTWELYAVLIKAAYGVNPEHGLDYPSLPPKET